MEWISLDRNRRYIKTSKTTQSGFGTAGASSTSALIFGGEPGTTAFTYTEKWNGSSWTEVNNLNTGRQDPALHLEL